MTTTQRGRIPYKVYVRAIGQMLGRDGYVLNTCEILTQFDRVAELMSAYPNQFYGKGYVVRLLLDKAIAHVSKVMQANGDPQSLRVVEFLALRQAEKKNAEIARMWGVTRECISRTISRQAVDLVTKRFLTLVRVQEVDKQPSKLIQNKKEDSA